MPKGALHLGNYFGAVEQWVHEIQSTHSEVTEPPDSRLFCVVDLHAITLPQKPEDLRSNIYCMAASLIGCGIGILKVFMKIFFCWISKPFFHSSNKQLPLWIDKHWKPRWTSNMQVKFSFKAANY